MKADDAVGMNDIAWDRVRLRRSPKLELEKLSILSASREK